MTDPTTDAPRAAVRPAAECYLVHDGHWFATSLLRADEIEPGDGDVLALAIDNATGGGIVARVRAAVEGISAIYPTTSGMILPAAMSHATVDDAVNRILAALGIATTTEPRHD